jgi:hypothetical protein
MDIFKVLKKKSCEILPKFYKNSTCVGYAAMDIKLRSHTPSDPYYTLLIYVSRHILMINTSILIKKIDQREYFNKNQHRWGGTIRPIYA